MIRFFLIFLLAASTAFGQGDTPTFQVDTMNALVQTPIPTVAGKLTSLVKGRLVANDGGGGMFFYQSASAATTNAGTIFKPAAATGRWLRQYSGPLNWRWFGATGTGADDYQAILNTITAALAASPVASVYAPAGTYVISTNIAITSELLLVGENVDNTTISYTGTANVDSVISFKGVAPGGLYNCGINGFTIKGNTHTLSALRLNAVHHSDIRNLKFRDCTFSGGYFDFCIATKFDTLSCSTSEGTFTTMPTHGLQLTNAVNACEIINPIMEGLSSGYGIRMDGNCIQNIIQAGTSESNLGGVWMTNGCTGNTLIALYLETNTSKDLVTDSTSTDNYFLDVLAATAVNIGGARNNFAGGSYNAFTVDASGAGTKMNGVGTGNNLGAFTDNGTATIYRDRFTYPTLTYERDQLNQFQTIQSTVVNPGIATGYSWLLNRGTTNAFAIGLDNTKSYVRAFNGNTLDITAQGGSGDISFTTQGTGELKSNSGLLMTGALGVAPPPSGSGIDYFSGGERFFAVGTTGTTPGTFTWLAYQTNGTSSQPLAVDSSGNLTIGNNVTVSGNKTTINTVQYTWPASFGAAGTYLKDAAGNGTLSWATAGTGTVTGTGTANTLTKWTSASAAGDSSITDDGTTVTMSERTINSFTGLASTPAMKYTGTWFTGGSATTTKPILLLEPSGTTSTAWSTAGTGLGINAASGFTGNLIDAQLVGVSKFSVNSGGSVVANAITLSSDLVGAATSQFYWNNRSVMASAVDGDITLRNFLGTSFGSLNFGGTSASFVRARRSGTTLKFELGDGSADAPITAAAGTFSGIINITGGSQKLNLTTPGTGVNYASILNTGGSLYFGTESVGGAAIFTGGSSYAGVIGTGGATSLQLATGNTVRQTIDSSGNVQFTGLITSYNNIATAGSGVPAIRANARSTAQTGAVASVAAYTVPAADGSFQVTGNVLVTTSSAEAFAVQVDYTSEDNVARTLTLPFVGLGGTTVAQINFANGAVPYEGLPCYIRAKASTTITVKTSGTFTGVVYNVEGSITRL